MERGEGAEEVLEAHRPRLRAVAYRMLGSLDEADDALQEVWFRLVRADLDAVDNMAGWLTTVVGRVCLDRLRARRSARERIGADLGGPLGDGGGDPAADPVADPAADPDADPEQQALVTESVGVALLVVLDLLPPAERVAFVLHDVFAVPFADVGPIVGRSPVAARQLASRARRRLQGAPAGPARLDVAEHRRVVEAFLAAARRGDLAGLVALLAPDAELRPDAAALGMGAVAATRGAEAVAGALAAGVRAAEPALVGSMPGLAWVRGGQVRGAIELTVVGGRIVAVDVVGDADRLVLLDVLPLGKAPAGASSHPAPRDPS
jgi:RNA polymerase sigma-70 factor (ECF subfamily)